MQKQHRQQSTAAVRYGCHPFLILLSAPPDIVAEGHNMDKNCCQRGHRLLRNTKLNNARGNQNSKVSSFTPSPFSHSYLESADVGTSPPSQTLPGSSENK